MDKEKLLNIIEEMQGKVEFDELLHKYWFNEKETISCTQLLGKHNITTDYKGVDKFILERARDRGNKIHKDIEWSIRYEVAPETGEGKWYREKLRDLGLEPVQAEFKVGNDIVCGTCDTILLDKDGNIYFDDHKTGSVLNMEAVKWQNSIYAYLLGIYDLVKDSLCSHLPKNGYLEIVSTGLVPKEEIEKLFECERKNKNYKECEIIKESMEPIYQDVKYLSEYVNNLNKCIDGATKRLDELKEKILGNMQANDVWKMEFDGLSFTRTKEYEKTTFDSKKFKEERPEEYEKYSKTTNVGENLRINLGGNKNEINKN